MAVGMVPYVGRPDAMATFTPACWARMRVATVRCETVWSLWRSVPSRSMASNFGRDVKVREVTGAQEMLSFIGGGNVGIIVEQEVGIK